LRRLFLVLREAGLTAKPSKTVIGVNEIDFLGHVIGSGVMKPQPLKVQSLLSLKPPKTKKDVRSLLGMLSYYRKFIPHFASLSCPLTDLLVKGKPNVVRWSEQCENALRGIQQCFSKSPVLVLPDLKRQFVVRTDASDVGVGAVLLQEYDILMPVAFASRKLLDREKNFSAIERECLAIVFAIKKFEKYLLLTHFVVETDHRPLLFLKQGKTTNSRLMRWSLYLQQYSFTIRAIPGSINHHADVLSRLL